MDRLFPIDTIETTCQDCYKCLRQCPVKAIRIEGGHAKITPELCVACGACVQVCPVQAKKIRLDLGRARRLVDQEGQVFVSLAPSWVGEYPGLKPEQMVVALKSLGFSGVSETALGAQEVSAVVAGMLNTNGLHISSACPATVRLIKKYLPEHVNDITAVHSPVMAHCKLLREHFGEGTRVVFIGPCIAKKTEADEHRELLEIALSFEELNDWFAQMKIDPYQMEPGEEDHFVPSSAEEGSLYPVEGGMVTTIQAQCSCDSARYVTVSGIENIFKTLEGVDSSSLQHPVFIEALGCEGGCIGGPCAQAPGALLGKRVLVEDQTIMPPLPLVRKHRLDISRSFTPDPPQPPAPDPALVREALRRIGKRLPEDELNCSGCGYNTCREFATALVRGTAEETMCVSHMRALAQKKANALLRSMPSGVVIVDANMRIVECNERFARMFGTETAEIYETCPGLKGCSLAKVIDFTEMFRTALKFDQEIHYDHFRYQSRLLNITVFSLDPHQTVGAVILDVTRQEGLRDQIAQQAQEVIRRNHSTDQDIAARQGEHMADTEILLRSIAEGYAVENKRLQSAPPPEEEKR